MARQAAGALIDPILVDECLSPTLAVIAKQHGHDAMHVVWLGRQGTKDHALMPIIAERGYIFVTQNRSDFLRLYSALDMHNGLVVLLPNAGRDEQERLFGIALVELEQRRDLTNLLIEVHADGRVEVRDWVTGKADAGPYPAGS